MTSSSPSRLPFLRNRRHPSATSSPCSPICSTSARRSPAASYTTPSDFWPCSNRRWRGENRRLCRRCRRSSVWGFSTVRARRPFLFSASDRRFVVWIVFFFLGGGFGLSMEFYVKRFNRIIILAQHDMQMICRWYADDMQMICKWYALCRWYADDMQMICRWYANDMQMICTMQMICRWYADDMQMICRWYADDMQMICRWYDMEMICRWYADDINKCRWYADDMQMICGWYADDMQMICRWYADEVAVADDMQMICRWSADDRYAETLFQHSQG